MKNHIHILLLCLAGAWLLVTQDLQAQRALLRPPGPLPADKSPTQTAEQQTVLKNILKKAKAGRVTVFHFDGAALEGQSLLLSLPTGETVEAVLDERDLRTQADFSWHGHLKGRAGSAVFTFLEGQLSGNLIVGNKSYAISPLGSGACTVYEIENVPSPEAHSGDYREDAAVSIPVNGGNHSAGNPCGVVRLLVAFTPAAEAGAIGLGYPSMKLFIQQAISATNQIYLNSNVGYRVSLAAAIRVSYPETGNFTTDLSRFRGTSDGFMDEIHRYRSRYSADVGVLLLDNASLCGQAPEMGSSAATAFSAVHFSCALGNSSFGRGIAVGTDSRRNNARVLSERAGMLAGHQVAPAILTLTGAESLKGNETGFATATEEIILSPGFVAGGTSQLQIAVTPACNPALVTARTDALGGEVAQKAGMLPESALQLSPVPTSGTLTIRVNLPASAVVDVGLYNMLGNRLQDVYRGEVAQKQFTADLRGHPQGFYIVRLRTATGVLTKKAILQK
ncbi:MAG: T9SS type A sorting domain-containing protein [Cytophagales bacterium]|nr:T9SS type A sorting domain-containing protein [Cytophagales bacterium]